MGIRLKHKKAYENVPGRIFAFDMNKPEVAPEEVKIVADPSFKIIAPHGLNIWTHPETGIVYLYLVSHYPEEIVDKFSFDEPTRMLKHLRRITGDSNFHQLNDLAVVAEDQFYFSNFYYAHAELEVVLRLRWGSIGFFDGAKATILKTGLFTPNGLMLSPDQKYLYANFFGDEELHVYRRSNDNNITLYQTLKLNSGVDNLFVDRKTGDVWIGSHPVMIRLAAYNYDPAQSLSPSQVLRIRMDADSRPIEVEEVYANDGTELSGSTVAVVHENRLLIGSMATHAVLCDMK